jgi:hypothetical protein
MESEGIHNGFPTLRKHSWPILNPMRGREGSSWHLTDDNIFEFISGSIHACGEASTPSSDNNKIVIKHICKKEHFLLYKNLGELQTDFVRKHREKNKSSFLELLTS